MQIGFPNLEQPKNEVTYAKGRLPTRTYASRSFAAQFGRDTGYPSRYIYRVFDELPTDDDDEWEWTSSVVYTTPGGRKQLQIQIARSEGAFRKLRLQRVPTNGDLTKLETLLELDRDQTNRLVDMLRAIEVVPVDGDSSVYVDDQLLKDVFADPSAIAGLYARDPDRFRQLIESDASATDVIALERRREVVAKMREWIEDDAAFADAAEEAGGAERAWQGLLEENPWVLGVGLGGQLFTSWNDERLEQTVVGRDVGTVGKRVDALLRTAGIIRSFAFAEIKHHQTDLLETSAYRAGCWGPSKELSGAIVQVQQTAHLASRDLGDYLQDKSEEGELLPSGTFLLRPRTFVVIGTLSQLNGPAGGVVPDKFRSFELFRRNLQEPEVMTFDELVARAEWHVNAASNEADQASSS